MIDKDTVAHLASLARIRVSDAEAHKLQGELAEVLEYVGALQKVDTSGLSKQGVVGDLRNVWREDEPVTDRDREAILEEAPERSGDYMVVKKVIAYDD